jgi:lambda repressor-like predicted transcriptional regulator
MKTARFTDEQIIAFLKQAEAGMSIKELCRSSGFSQPTSTSGALSSAAWRPLTLQGCEIWNPRTPSSRSYWPRPIWIFTPLRACLA